MTLEEFYNEFSNSDSGLAADVGRNMLRFIDSVNTLFKETQIWGLTSHARLVLQNTNGSYADWSVIVSNIGTDDYYFEYLLPANKQPWTNAYVKGEAHSLREAQSYLIIAMSESGSWPNSAELQILVSKQ